MIPDTGACALTEGKTLRQCVLIGEFSTITTVVHIFPNYHRPNGTNQADWKNSEEFGIMADFLTSSYIRMIIIAGCMEAEARRGYVASLFLHHLYKFTKKPVLQVVVGNSHSVFVLLSICPFMSSSLRRLAVELRVSTLGNDIYRTNSSHHVRVESL